MLLVGSLALVCIEKVYGYEFEPGDSELMYSSTRDLVLAIKAGGLNECIWSVNKAQFERSRRGVVVQEAAIPLVILPI